MSVPHHSGPATEPARDSARTLKVDRCTIAIRSRRLDQHTVRVDSQFDPSGGDDFGNFEGRFQEWICHSLQEGQRLTWGLSSPSFNVFRVEFEDREINQGQIGCSLVRVGERPLDHFDDRPIRFPGKPGQCPTVFLKFLRDVGTRQDVP